MKYIARLTLPLILSVLFSCSGGHNHLARTGLKGPVKSVKEVECKPTHEGDTWVASENCSRSYRQINYTEEGNYKDMLTLDSKNDTLGITRMGYEDGELVEEIYYQKVGSSGQSKLIQGSRTLMEKVSSSQVNFEVWEQEALRFEGAIYFDSKGRIDKQIEVINNREAMVHYVYDKDLLLENYQIDLETGERIATQLYAYNDFDDQGNWTTKLIYVGEEKISPKVVITRTLEYY